MNSWKVIEKYKDIKVCRDPKDNIFIQVAKSCGSEIVVSDDDDLLSLKSYENIRIISPEIFIESYAEVLAKHSAY